METGEKHAVINQWLTLRCKLTYDQGKMEFTWLSAHHGKPVFNCNRENPVDGNLVPIISNDRLDEVAARFLKTYFPDALINPQPVPIAAILKEQMGLLLIVGGETTSFEESHEGEVFGKIYFSPTLIEFQCPHTKQKKSVKVPRGTIVIDPSATALDNPGLLNNTFTHEGFHWSRHRMFATVRNMLYGETFIACRNSKIKKFGSKWTSEERIEWQAKNIAPRIQMPRDMFKKKAKEVIAQYPHNALENDEVLNAVIKELADFFIVSRQSVRIRLEETGIIGQNHVMEGLKSYRDSEITTFIDVDDAFREYCENQEFRSIVDSGAVCYVENRYIVNDSRYIERTHSKPRLTAYARSHMNECALIFVKRKNYPQHIKGIAFRVDHKSVKEVSRYERKLNGQSVLNRVDEHLRLDELYKKDVKNFASKKHTFYQLASDIIKKKRWDLETFMEKTHLDKNFYYQIMGGDEKSNSKKLKGKTAATHKSNVSLRIVVSFCVGVDADIDTAEDLLTGAGLSFNTENYVYRFVILNLRGCSIDECNDFLELYDVEPLGSKAYKPRKVVNK